MLEQRVCLRPVAFEEVEHARGSVGEPDRVRILRRLGEPNRIRAVLAGRLGNSAELEEAQNEQAGDALQLGGDTVEVKFSVREKDKADTVIEFVAHYHADATGASTAARHASQWHLKKWTNNWAHKDLEPSALKYPNLFKLLPKRKDVLSNARPYKSGELLYSPK